MKFTEIRVENYENVYKYFQDLRPNHEKSIRRWAALMDLLLKARVNYAKGARKDLDVIHDKDYHHIYAFNHRSDRDGYVYTSAMRQIAPYDLCNVRPMVTVWCFEHPFAWVFENLGCIPVFLKRHYVERKKHRKHPERLELVPAATRALLDCFTYIQIEHRQKVVVFPEGDYNTGAPDTLLPIRRGAAEIARRVAEADGPVAITTIGLAYGKKKRWIVNPRHASTYVERSIFVEPGMTTDEITELIRVRLLSSVKKAVALY